MPFTVRCPHCETLLKVPDEYHYKVITCPKCNKEIEAISLETIEIGQKFLKQLEEQNDDLIIDESRPASRRHKKPPPEKKDPPKKEDPGSKAPRSRDS